MDRTNTLGPAGRDLWKRMSDAYTLDVAQQEVLLAACRELDVSEGARKGADPATADGRRRLSIARQSNTAFVSHMRSLDRLLKPDARKPARRPTPKAPTKDPREVLA